VKQYRLQISVVDEWIATDWKNMITTKAVKPLKPN
jgi:hypothetical protein